MLLNTAPEPYAVYGRISMDKDNDRKGVTRQVELGHQLANSRGLVLADVAGTPGWGRGEFVDNDVSASKGNRREWYERLINYAADGTVKVIVLYMSSRLWRNRKERAIAFERLAAANVRIIAVRGQDIDLSTAAGRMLAGILGEVDAHETEQMGERRRDAMAQQAREGYYQGPTPFGYRKVYRDVPLADGSMGRKYTGKLEVVPDLRDAIQDAAQRIIAGGSLRGIALEWNARGILTARGKQWTGPQVRQMLLAPYIVGIRGGGANGPGRDPVYKRWTPQDADNHAGGWEPVLDLETRDMLYQVVTNPERRLGPGRTARYLLSGIATCGLCGTAVYCRKSKSRGRELLHYSCPQPPVGCAKTSRMAPVVDAWVLAHIAHWLLPNGAYDAAVAAATVAARPEMAVLLAEQQRDQLLRSRLDDRLADGEFDDVDGRTDREAYRRQCKRIEDRISERRRAMNRISMDRTMDAVPERGAAFMRMWKAADIDRRRALVQALVGSIVFEPTGKANKVDLSRIPVVPSALLAGAPADLLAPPAAA